MIKEGEKLTMSIYDPMIYRVEEENSERYYKMPKELFLSELYKGLSSDARVLYSILMDRKELSRKNGWVDEYGQVFLIYTREHIADLLNVSIRTAGKVFKQLREADLIIEAQQGLNKPNKIYVKRVTYSVGTKGQAECSGQDKHKLLTNDTELKETESNNNSERDSQYYSIYELSTLGSLTDNIEVAWRIMEYGHKYQWIKGTAHPKLKESQLVSAIDTLESIDEKFGLTTSDWNSLIDRYFAESPSDCNINHFTHGNELAGTIRGMLS